MARIARIVVSDFPHHITQRGNRRQRVFFLEKDYKTYLRYLSKYSDRFRLQILSYCLMPNHIHLIAIPKDEGSLARAIGETHRNYTRMINFREDWRGYLWQGRFSSYVLDERYFLLATRYILLNPVKAKIVKKAEEYKWSSIRHHLKREKISFINDELLQSLVADWDAYLKIEIEQSDVKMLKLHEGTGRPLGNNLFIEKLEKLLDVDLRKKKPGRKRKEKDEE